MKLIIPMAGRGTRVRPHSHVTPKPLLPVKGRTMVERIVDTFNSVLPRNLDSGVFVLGPDFGADVREKLSGICDSHGMEAHFAVQERDRKSTRLNSSHVAISYAVFCLKKKK